MLNCRQATRLVSKSMDAKLSWPNRFWVWLHLLYCVWCRRYAAQLQFLRRAARNLPAEHSDSPARLSIEEKEQMRARLKKGLDQPPAAPQ